MAIKLQGILTAIIKLFISLVILRSLSEYFAKLQKSFLNHFRIFPHFINQELICSLQRLQLLLLHVLTSTNLAFGWMKLMFKAVETPPVLCRNS